MKVNIQLKLCLACRVTKRTRPKCLFVFLFFFFRNFCFPFYSSHAVTSDVSLLETVKAAEFFLADGVVLTGKATGERTDVRDLAGIRSYRLRIFEALSVILIEPTNLSSTFYKFVLPNKKLRLVDEESVARARP